MVWLALLLERRITAGGQRPGQRREATAVRLRAPAPLGPPRPAPARRGVTGRTARSPTRLTTLAGLEHDEPVAGVERVGGTGHGLDGDPRDAVDALVRALGR